MTISTLDLTRVRQSVCPHCGHQVDSPTSNFLDRNGARNPGGCRLGIDVSASRNLGLEVVRRFPVR